MKRHYTIRFYTLLSMGVIALLVFILSLGFAGGLILAPHLANSVVASSIQPARTQSHSIAALTEEEDQLLSTFESALGNLYDASVSSVVRINVTQTTQRNQRDNDEAPDRFPGPGNPFGFPFPQQGQGSGFVWDKEGHIVTNFHVVDGASKLEVLFANGTNVEAEVIGTDPDSDLAVIKVDLPAADLQPMPIGDSDTLRVGQITAAIGAPFGQDFTMTSGIVSAIGRTIRSGNTPFSIPEAIQTDASINPGNSGGPLLNRHGEVIGINTQILSRSGSNSGVGFAVPINIAKRVIPTLVAGQNFEYAWLGISGGDVNDEVATLMKLPKGTQGTLIFAVSDDSPAEKAGLQGSDEVDTIDDVPYRFGGDIITAINGEPLTSINDLIVYLVNETRPGDEVTLDVIRDGQTIQVEVTLGSRPDN